MPPDSQTACMIVFCFPLSKLSPSIIGLLHHLRSKFKQHLLTKKENVQVYLSTDQPNATLTTQLDYSSISVWFYYKALYINVQMFDFTWYATTHCMMYITALLEYIVLR